MRRHFFTTLALLILTTSIRADDLPGHSLHGESFNEGPRQAAVLLGGTGRVKFASGSKVAEAQPFFEQGVGQLHGFWYFEAERSFRTAAALDPDCAMFYWGLAMANVNNEKRAKEFLKKAVERKEKTGAKEKLWIATLENFYKDDKRDKKQRHLDYIRDLEQIVQEHPDDIEAKAFLVWKIWDARDSAPISSHQAVDALLDQVFTAEPMHPAHHYRIHLWDNAKPARAVASAAKCGQAAPSIAHMWHMPGHTYSKLRRFDDAAWQQEAATRADHQRMITDLVLPDQIHNYAHNEEWLVRTFNELGRAHDAIALARSLIEIPRHPKFNTLDKANTSASYGRTRLLDTLQKWELWDSIITLASGAYLGSTEQASHETTRLRALGVAQFHQGKTSELNGTLAALEALDKKEKAKPKSDTTTKTSAKPDATKPAASQPKTEVRKAEPVVAKKDAPAADKSKAGKPDAKPAVATPMQNALNELRGLVALLKKDGAAARKALEAASDIPKDRLARYFLKLDNKKKAEELTKNFNQDLAGLAAKTEVLLACGKEADAKTAFEAVRKAAFAMDRDLPVAKRLDALAAKFGVSGEWRSAAPKRTDNGVRPPLDSLGPVHWHPPVARAWSALDAGGKAVSNQDYRGKNLLLCLYLGHQCGHCMEQLNAIAKVADQFKAAGIEMAAISLEKPADLAKAKEKAGRKDDFPFPLLSDERLSAFKTWRAFDDFEQMPLHALVLVDAGNHVRWIDIGYDPFTDTKFLLDECRRLLKLPAAAGAMAASTAK